MSQMDIDQVDAVMREFEFVQTEAGGLFRWYEFPAWKKRREQKIWTYCRAQFYAGRSDFQVWIFTDSPSHYKRTEEVFNDYAESPEQVASVLRRALLARHHIAIEELVRWEDGRVTQFSKLFQAARDPRRDQREGAELVLADLLLERGVAF